MASRAEVEQQRQAQALVASVAATVLVQQWRSLDPTDIGGARSAMNQAVAAVVDAYGEAAAELAATFFDDLRRAAGRTSRTSAVLAEPLPRGRLENAIQAAITPAFPREAVTEDGETVVVPGDTAKAEQKIEATASRLVRQQARDTIADNTARDTSGAWWARVPTGASTCAFCMILASRGEDYKSEHSALFAENGRRYHDDCDCVAVPIWSDEDYPEGYDPEDLYDKYLTAREQAGSGDLKDITAAMREQLGVK